jgi:hypothetical protein
MRAVKSRVLNEKNKIKQRRSENIALKSDLGAGFVLYSAQFPGF